MKSIVYVLTNDAMPGYVKIGITDNLTQRMSSLYSTSVPLPFKCYYAAEVEDAEKVEEALFRGFGDFRANTKREFLQISPNRIQSIIELVAQKDVTPKNEYFVPSEDLTDTEVEADELMAKSTRYSFSSLGISTGTKLIFTKDSNIFCTVVNDKEVDLDGTNLTLSKAALISLHKVGYRWKTARGSEYWLYNGVPITELSNI